VRGNRHACLPHRIRSNHPGALLSKDQTTSDKGPHERDRPALWRAEARTGAWWREDDDPSRERNPPTCYVVLVCCGPVRRRPIMVCCGQKQAVSGVATEWSPRWQVVNRVFQRSVMLRSWVNPYGRDKG
jgi:hypothetical protein